MGNRREHLHAFFQVGGDACLHRVEGAGGVGHFGRAVFVEVDRVRIGVEGFHGVGQAGRAGGSRCRTASQVQAIISASCPSSTTGSHGDSGTIAGRTSMVTGLPSPRRRCP